MGTNQSSIVTDKFILHPVSKIENGVYVSYSNFPYPPITDHQQEEAYVRTHHITYGLLFRSLMKRTPIEVTHFETEMPGEDNWGIIDTYAEGMLRELYRFRALHRIRTNFSNPGYSGYAWGQLKVFKEAKSLELAVRGELVYKPLEMGERHVKDFFAKKVDILTENFHRPID